MSGLLVADDEAIVRSTVNLIVSRGAPEIQPIGEAGSGEEAISMARQMHPNIVLMDVKMPGLNGLEATRTIRQEYPSTKVIMLTAYDEFSYSQEALRLGAVDYLLKPIRPNSLLDVLSRVYTQVQQEEKHLHETEMVSNRLRDTLPIIESRLVQDLVHGTVGDKSALERLSRHINKTITYPAVMVVDIDRFNQATEGMEAEKFDRFGKFLTDIVRRTVPDPEHSLIGQVWPGVIVAILSTDPDSPSNDLLRQIGHTIRRAVESNAPVTASIGIGRSYPKLGKVCLSYAEALRVQWYKLRFGCNTVIHVDDVEKPGLSPAPYPIEMETELVENIRIGYRQASAEILNRMVNTIMDNFSDPPEMILTRLMELDVLMSRAVTAAGAPSQEVLQLSHRQIMRLGMIRTRADIQSWALNSLDEFVNQIPSTDRGSKLVEQAIGFMRQKLNCSGLELKDVAQAVHVSPSYLAHLFKIKMGTTYVKYMTRLRIEEARRLLRSTDMTVSAIAAAVGYEDPAYFHRIFRRESMITPMAYRHQARIS